MIERKFIQQNLRKMELEEYLGKKLDRAGFTHADIVKTPMVTRIILHVSKPGLAIGKGGQTIKQLTEVIGRDYKIDNPQIEIQEVKNANLNAKILVEKMAAMIEREFSWRSVVFKAVSEIVNSGAQGVELVVKGKLSGKGGRKRKMRIAFGYMKKIGEQSRLVDFAKAPAYPKAGAIGLRLRIIHPGVVFPDKIDVTKVIQDKRQLVEDAKEVLEKKEDKVKKIVIEEEIEEEVDGEVIKEYKKVEAYVHKKEAQDEKETKTEKKKVKEEKKEVKVKEAISEKKEETKETEKKEEKKEVLDEKKETKEEKVSEKKEESQEEKKE